MKNKVYLVVGIILILGLVGLTGCTAARAATADVQPVSINLNAQQGITVNGQGKITVTPDIATLSLGISAQASSVADAQSQASAAMDKVIAALKDAGIDARDIKTQYFNIQQITRPEFVYSSSRATIAPLLPYDSPLPDEKYVDAEPTKDSMIILYQVSNMVSVKIRDIDKTGSIIDAAAAAGGDLIRVNGVYFSVDQPEQYYNQARTLAVEDAKAKAQSLAALAGVNLGKASYVSEYSSVPGAPYYDGGYAGDIRYYPAATSISPGQTDIVLSVQVIFDIQ